MSNELIIYNNLITEPIINILKQVKIESNNGLLHDIINKGDDVLITCPFHANGHEKTPACFVYSGESDSMERGTFHCFTCHEKGPLYKLVGACFGRDNEFGKDWLIQHYGSLVSSSELKLNPISLERNKEEYLDESILDNFESYHPYLEKRHLSKEVCERFKVKYDPDTSCIVFPVWDRYGKLKFLTRRSVISKKFIIDSNASKDNIYLLNEVIKNNLNTVVVVESQINALTLWQYGYPAIALFGAGTTDGQMKQLNQSPIRHYILAYDNDQAGIKGSNNFKKLIRKDVFVDELIMPVGRDVNDLTSEEIFLNFGKFFNK